MKTPALMSNREFGAELKEAFSCIGCGTPLEICADFGTATRRRVIERGLCWVCRRSQITVAREMASEASE